MCRFCYLRELQPSFLLDSTCVIHFIRQAIKSPGNTDFQLVKQNQITLGPSRNHHSKLEASSRGLLSLSEWARS